MLEVYCIASISKFSSFPAEWGLSHSVTLLRIPPLSLLITISYQQAAGREVRAAGLERRAQIAACATHG